MEPTSQRDASLAMRRGVPWLPWLAAGALVLVAIAVLDAATSTEPGPDAVRVPPILTGPELVACSHKIVVGELRRVEEAGRAESTVDVRVEVQEWLVPEAGTRHSVDLTTLAPWYSGERRLRVGERVLAIEWGYPYASATRLFRAGERQGVPSLADVRAQIERDLPQARRTPCPGFWSDPQGYHADVPDDA